MVIIILGSSGFIGSNLYKHLKKNHNVKTINLRKINFSSSKKELETFFFNKFKKSDYIINCCASLKPKNKNDYFVNTLLPRIIQKSILKLSKKPFFIHFSTLNVLINQRSDKYTISKKLGEKKLNKQRTSIIRLPFIIDENNYSGNLKILNRYLNLNFLPIYPMIYPGHLYKPIEIKKLCFFVKNIIKSKKKNYIYNLIGNKKISFWDLFEKIAIKKNKKVIKINSNYLNIIFNKNITNSFIRNNDLLSQLFSIDQTNLKNVKITKL